MAYFPNPDSELYDDVIAVGYELKEEIILEAYAKGVFPWPHEDLPMLWCCPQERGILEFKNLHLPKSFKKFLRQTDFKVQFNQQFDEVIQACSEVPRPGQDGTWISKDIIDAYMNLHKKGYAHSVEVLDGQKLVGGLYGIFNGGVFAGESMFFKKNNASKLALYACIEHLKARGHQWMDIQMLTPVTEQFGGIYLPRKTFLKKLRETQLANSDHSEYHIIFSQEGPPFGL